jgi:signal recognition particle subunit SRP54
MAWFTRKKKTEENVNENTTAAAGAIPAEEKAPSGIKDIAARMMSGQFDMNDMLAQLKQIKKMSNFSGLLKMMPGMGAAVGAMKEKIKDGSIDRQIKILEAMTAEERADPDKVFANAKIRIAEKSGATVREVEHIIKQYQNMRRQMAMVQRMGGMDAMMEKMKQSAPGGGNAPIGNK